MESKIYHLRQIINDSPIPNGEYLGVWGGHRVRFWVDDRQFEAQTQMGMRGFNVSCDVIVCDDGITIRER